MTRIATVPVRQVPARALLRELFIGHFFIRLDRVLERVNLPGKPENLDAEGLQVEPGVPPHGVAENRFHPVVAEEFEGDALPRLLPCTLVGNQVYDPVRCIVDGKVPGVAKIATDTGIEAFIRPERKTYSHKFLPQSLFVVPNGCCR